MSELSVFNFQSHPIRVVMDNGEPFWVGRDLCDVLGYKDPKSALSQHCKGVVKRLPLQTAGGVQELRVLSEPDMYRLIIGSKLPAAQAFEAWVFEEVLPTIRKTGSYSIAPPPPPVFNVPTTFAGALRLALEQAELIEQQTALIAQQAPAVAYVEKFVKADGLIGVREAAKSLGLNQNAFVSMMIDAKLMFRENGHLQAYAPDIDAGRFVVQTGTDSTGRARASTKFTAKGLRWVAGKLRLDQLFQD